MPNAFSVQSRFTLDPRVVAPRSNPELELTPSAYTRRYRARGCSAKLASMRIVSFKLIFALLLVTIAFPTVSRTQAQNPAADVVMVLPFENTSNRAEYNWVGESFADSLAELLNKPGLVVVSSAERELAYHHLRLPETVIPSRVTASRSPR